MKVQTPRAILVTLLACTLAVSCQNGVTSPASTAESRSVQSWSLWEPLDSFNSSVWQEANWTNGGMFNCGFVPGNIGFANVTVKSRHLA